MEAIWIAKQTGLQFAFYEVAVERKGALYYVDIVVSPTGQRSAFKCIREAGVNRTPRSLGREIEVVAKAAILQGENS